MVVLVTNSLVSEEKGRDLGPKLFNIGLTLPDLGLYSWVSVQ